MLAIDAVGSRHGVKGVFLVPPVHEPDRRDSVVNRIFDRALALARMSPSSITARCVATQSCSKAGSTRHHDIIASWPRSCVAAVFSNKAKPHPSQMLRG